MNNSIFRLLASPTMALACVCLPQFCLAQSVEDGQRFPQLPSGWQGSRTEASCSIWRADENRFESFSIGLDNSLRLRIHKADWRFAVRKNVPIEFNIAEEQIPGAALTAITTNNMVGVVGVIPAAVGKYMIDDRQVSLTIGPPVNETMPLENLGDLLGWLRDCRMALPAYDPATAVVTPPKLVSSADVEDFANLPRGLKRLSYVLSISPDGRAASCRATQSTGNFDADKRICDILVERMRFEPGLNKAGTPVEATYRSGVAFGN